MEDSLFDCEYIETKAGNNRFKKAYIIEMTIEDMQNLKKGTGSLKWVMQNKTKEKLFQNKNPWKSFRWKRHT